MNARRLKKFKEQLLDMKRETYKGLLNENETLSSLSKNEIGDEADVAFQSYEKDFLINLTNKEKIKLERISAALDRIEKNTFGICVDCNAKIEEARLEAIPFTFRCVSCESQRQEKNKKTTV